MRRFLTLAALSHVLAGALAADQPSVSIASGTVKGGICAGAPDAVYYKAVPYALPPTGERRFASPQPYSRSFPGRTLNATKSAPSCIQFGPPSTFTEKGSASEDCLYLDIWTPATANKDSALPVRVWLYGGSEIDGGISDPTYDGCQVPETHALMVSVNYRLGPLGFLTLENAGLRGNQAIEDILLALEWVQKNIAAFGGDPKKVMLHGQSAGAANTYVVASLPEAPRLMSSAIMESGGGRDAKLKSAAQELGTAFTKALNCSMTDVSCLRRAPVTDLQEVFNTLPLLDSSTYGQLTVDNITVPGFGPFVDGVVVPQQPSAKGTRVPAIFGSNSLEGTIFTIGQFEESTKGNPALAVNASVYHTVLEQSFGPANAKLIEHYLPISTYNSTPFPAFFAVSMILTYSEYLCPAYRGLTTAAANGVPVWTYQFSHNPSCPWYSTIPVDGLRLLGATHTSEIPFMLGTTNHLPRPDGNCTMTPTEQSISKFMNGAWTTMADAQKPVADPKAWPQFTGPKQGLGLQIANSTTPGHIDYRICELWDKINAEILAGSGCEE